VKQLELQMLSRLSFLRFSHLFSLLFSLLSSLLSFPLLVAPISLVLGLAIITLAMAYFYRK
jgi:hypothetical protein